MGIVEPQEDIRNVRTNFVIISVDEHNRLDSLVDDIKEMKKAKAMIVHYKTNGTVKFESLSEDKLVIKITQLAQLNEDLKEDVKVLQEKISESRKTMIVMGTTMVFLVAFMFFVAEIFIW